MKLLNLLQFVTQKWRGADELSAKNQTWFPAEFFAVERKPILDITSIGLVLGLSLRRSCQQEELLSWKFLKTHENWPFEKMFWKKPKRWKMFIRKSPRKLLFLNTSPEKKLGLIFEEGYYISRGSNLELPMPLERWKYFSGYEWEEYLQTKCLMEIKSKTLVLMFYRAKISNRNFDANWMCNRDALVSCCHVELIHAPMQQLSRRVQFSQKSNFVGTNTFQDCSCKTHQQPLDPIEKVSFGWLSKLLLIGLGRKSNLVCVI